MLKCHPRLPLVVTGSNDRAFKVCLTMGLQWHWIALPPHLCICVYRATCEAVAIPCSPPPPLLVFFAQIWDAGVATDTAPGEAKAIVWNGRSAGCYKHLPVRVGPRPLPTPGPRQGHTRAMGVSPPLRPGQHPLHAPLHPHPTPPTSLSPPPPHTSSPLFPSPLLFRTSPLPSSPCR